nr:MAG TPA: hypothetical protein [Caudoviricetes sp.]
MISKINEILKEGGVYSLTRILSVIGFVAFLIGSCYLIYKGQTWGNYETFATMTGGGSAATQIANKLINSKYNSSPGDIGKRIGDDK